MLEYLPYVLLFAFITMILYLWGLYRSLHQQRDLSRLLLSKGVHAVQKELKKSDGRTKRELQPCVSTLEAGLLFGRKRLAVTDPVQFLDSVLRYMTSQNLLRTEIRNGEKIYFLK